MNWTDDHIALLTRLWADGMSASQIAKHLGDGFTRNSVIGKIHRLRAKGRVLARRIDPCGNGKGEVVRVVRRRYAKPLKSLGRMTAEQVDRFRDQYDHGTRLADIGQNFGMSRTSVVRLAHHLGLAPRAVAPEQSKNKTFIIGGNRPTKPQAPRPDLWRKDEPVKVGEVGIIEIGFGQCRFPMQGRGMDMLFCGDAVKVGESWCPTHCARVFVPQRVSERRREREIA